MTLLSGDVKRSSILLELSWGRPGALHYYRVTNRSGGVIVSGATFRATPTLRLEKAKNIGTLGDRQMEVEVQYLAGDEVERMSSGEPHALVYANVRELIEDLDTGDRLVIWLFRGKVSRAFRNPDGKDELIRFRLADAKARLKWPVQAAATATCIWTLFKRGCFLQKRDFLETGTITAIDGKVVTITGLADHSADPTERYWHRGNVDVDGLELLVRDWQQSDPTRFVLQREPPADWLNADCEVVPGCSKTPDVCDQRYGNLEHFAGLGHAMQAYNPVVEDPKGSG